MKVPGGWKAFFINWAVASVLVYIVKYFMGAAPTVGGAIFFALVVCLIISFVESRFRKKVPVDTLGNEGENSSVE